MPRIRKEAASAERAGAASVQLGREVDLRVRLWGLLNTPEFERWKRRHAAGWGLELRVFTESAMLDIMLLNIARTYKSPDLHYAHVPLNGDANRHGRTGDPGMRRKTEPSDSKEPVKVFDRGDAFVGELVRRRVAGDPAQARTVRLSEYGRLQEIRQALVRRHKDLGAETDSQIVDAMIAVFHGVETGRCQLSRTAGCRVP